MDKRIATLGSHRRLTHDYINDRCRLLTDQRFFNCTDIWDMERLLKFFKQRKLAHVIKYSADRENYTVVVTVPIEKPLNVISSDRSLSIALALCGVQLAELAEL